MRIIDADKFLKYLIFSKHIDGLTCGEVKEAIEMCEVDILDKIKAEIDEHIEYNKRMNYMGLVGGLLLSKAVLDKYKTESEEAADDKEAD